MKILHLSITVFASMLLIHESYATTFASSSEAKICITDFRSETQCTNALSGGLTTDLNNQWSFDCQLNGTSLEFKGLAFCSSDTPASGTVADNITSGPFTSSPAPTGCWCKMTYPFSSQWVFYGSISGKNTCLTSCASACKIALSQNDSYNPMRTLMLTNPENQ